VRLELESKKRESYSAGLILWYEMSIYTTQQEHITRTGSPIIMTELNNCKLCYSGETVNCHIALDDVFSFKSFDEYVRSRFRIDENEDVRYEIENRGMCSLCTSLLVELRSPIPYF
jgi:hypothetical protein